MNHKPRVSILSPCYNVEAFLPQCIDSIIKQTYTNLQIVLIDDGSNDDTWSVMQHYAANDTRIEIYHQHNQGVASTRNHLLEKVNGDYVLFVYSDDWIEPDMVSFLVGKAMAGEADIVVCGMVKNDDTPKVQYTEEVLDQDTTVKKFLFHKELSGSLWNKLIKTSLLHGLRFDRRISYGEDALFCWHVLQQAHVIVFTDRQLYHYRMNENSLSHLNWTPEKKGSGHLVWQAITDDTRALWPQYQHIAKTNYAISDMWQLYYARGSNYPIDDNIRMFQKNVRKHLLMIFLSDIVNLKKKIFALVASYCYTLSGVFIR